MVNEQNWISSHWKNHFGIGSLTVIIDYFGIFDHFSGSTTIRTDEKFGPKTRFGPETNSDPILKFGPN